MKRPKNCVEDCICSGCLPKHTAREVLEALGESDFKRVVRDGVVVTKLICPKGFKNMGGRCVKMTAIEVKVRKKAIKRANKTKKTGGIMARAILARQRSMNQFGHIHKK